MVAKVEIGKYHRILDVKPLALLVVELIIGKTVHGFENPMIVNEILVMLKFAFPVTEIKKASISCYLSNQYSLSYKDYCLRGHLKWFTCVIIVKWTPSENYLQCICKVRILLCLRYLTLLRRIHVHSSKKAHQLIEVTRRSPNFSQVQFVNNISLGSKPLCFSKFCIVVITST